MYYITSLILSILLIRDPPRDESKMIGLYHFVIGFDHDQSSLHFSYTNVIRKNMQYYKPTLF